MEFRRDLLKYCFLFLRSFWPRYHKSLDWSWTSKVSANAQPLYNLKIHLSSTALLRLESFVWGQLGKSLFHFLCIIFLLRSVALHFISHSPISFFSCRALVITNSHVTVSVLRNPLDQRLLAIAHAQGILVSRPSPLAVSVWNKNLF